MSKRRKLQIISDLKASDIAAQPESFLSQLQQPTALLMTGHDRSRWRAIATLLHGNEPSGFIALHRWLRNFQVPAVNTLIFFGAVRTALHESLFKHRMIPGQRDLNRCFGAARRDDEPGLIAQEFLALLGELQPECLIDIHNTSGRSGSFGVVSHEDPKHEALVTLFTRRMIVTRIKLGALMETSRPGCPAVTIECGGAGSSESIEVAWKGLQRLLYTDQIPHSPPSDIPVDIYHDPVRLELTDDCRLEFSDQPVPGADVTVPTDIERLNFGIADSGRLIARLGPRSTSVLRVVDGAGERELESIFCIRDDCLFPSQPLKLFMATSNTRIALSDCLLYAAPESAHDHVFAVTGCQAASASSE